MKRDLQTMHGNEYDLLVVGGGIYGAAAAWEAASRGLAVALVEKGDFGAATSANSLKVIHGGLRYLQQLDLPRMRESIGERRALLRIAPHLVHPLPVLVPTYGHGLRGKEALGLALRLNDLVSFDRNRALASDKQIPPGRLLSREACLTLLPGLPAAGLNGAAFFHDAQVYNSERLTLAFLHSAANAGADLANYAQATNLLTRENRVVGASVLDALSGDHFEVRARAVLNAAGPWAGEVLARLGLALPRPLFLARAINVVTRQLLPEYAVGLSAPGDRRLVFVVPWRGHSLIGTTYAAHGERPAEPDLQAGELASLLEAVNAAYPAFALTTDDVRHVHVGLLPASSGGNGAPSLWRHFGLYDHGADGVAGLVTALGVKYTTARHVAEKAVDVVFHVLGRVAPPSRTASTPLHGGRIGGLTPYLAAQQAALGRRVAPQDLRRLVYSYGSAFARVLDYGEGEGEDGTLSAAAVLRAEVRHAACEEMAVRLADVVLRRTEVGSAGRPEEGVLRLCAETMATALGWGASTLARELRELEAAWPWIPAIRRDHARHVAA